MRSCVLLIVCAAGCSNTTQSQKPTLDVMELKEVTFLHGRDGQLTIDRAVQNKSQDTESGNIELMVYDGRGQAFGSVLATVDSVKPNEDRRFAIPVSSATRGFVWQGFLKSPKDVSKE